MATSGPMSAAASGAVLRDFLLAAERTKQPLDAAVQRFADAATRESRILQVFLEASPHADAVFHIWPDESGKGTRWEDRESIARFLEVVNNLLQVQLVERQAQDAAEAMALKIVREKSANLEKLLSWSDKPIIEFRVLELMATIVSVSAAAARELVRIFNFQGASFAKIAGRRMKKPIATATEPEATVHTATPSFQIRAAYVQLVAVLAACADKSVHRFALKEGGLTASLLKSVDGDDAEMMAVVLGHLDKLVLQNENLDTRGRTAIFNNAAVQQLVAVVKSEDEDAASQAWTLVHKLFFTEAGLFRLPARQSLRLFLLKPSVNAALASADAVAVVDAAAANDNGVTENINATVKVIRNVIGAVSVNDYVRSERVRELVAKFLLEYPGLVAEFFQILAPQLEPKTGYRWFSVASMVQNLLSTSLDSVIPDIQAPASATIDSVGGYTAQLLASRLILPLNCRKELSRGLQHTNNLVIYSSLGIMECTLRRFQFIQANLPTGVSRSELENEFRFLLPSPEALVSLLMKLSATVDTAALAYLRALAVFRLYLECLPQAMSEVKADFTKLLAWQYLDATDAGNMSRAMRGVIAGEVLRILMVVDESRLQYVVASGAASNDSRSKLSQLLRLFASSAAASGQATRVLARGVLVRVLTALKVFGTDGGEVIGVWLDNLATGGDGSIEFVETILQDLVVDPFAFLPASSSESESSSPATLALIAALHGRWPLPRSVSKLDAVRQNAAVLAFGSRVLLSLMSRSVEPKSMARLICGSQSDDESDGESRSTKKRRRSESVDFSALTSFQCLQLLAQQILSPKTIRPVDSSVASSEWKPTKSKAAFVDALFSATAASFVSQFSKIVQDLLRHNMSAVWLHQYIGARPDVDMVALVDSVASVAKTDKQFGSIMRDLVDTLPLHLFSQRIVFALATQSSADQHGDVAKLVKQLATRLESLFPGQARDAVALAAEQLLVAIQLLRSGSPNSLVGSLADVLLRSLVVVATGEDETTTAASASASAFKRLRLKLKNAAAASTNEPKLVALDMVALSIGTTDENAIAVGQRLRHSGSAVATVLLAKRLPVVLRLQILSKLLSLRSTVRSSTRHAPVVASIMDTLDANTSIRGFVGTKRLSGQVWSALLSLGKQPSDAKTLRVLSAGLHILAQLGGVSEAAFRESIPSTWVRVYSESISKNAELGVSGLVKLIRRVCSAIAPRELVAGRVSGLSAVEELINQALKKTAGNKSTHVLAVAISLMATYGTDASSQVNTAAQDARLLAQVVQSVMRVSAKPDADVASLGLIVLRHAASHSEASSSVFNALVEVIQFLKIGSSLTPSQVLALLLTLRNRSMSESQWSSDIASFLIRSAVAYASDADEINGADSILQSLFVAIQDLLLHAPSQSAVAAVATKTATDIKKLLDADFASESAYIRFIRASRVVVSLVSASEASVKGYNVSEHFEKLTKNALFAGSLSNPSVNVELIRLVANLLRLGPETMYSRTVFQHLLGAYNASLSLPDRMIRALLDDFESKVAILASQYGYRFGASSMVLSQKQDGSIRSDLVEDSAWLLSGGLEASRVRATIEWFPLNRAVSVKSDAHLLLDEYSESDEDDSCADVEEQALAVVYDPSYLLPMLSRFVSSSALSDVAIVQQGVLGVALRAVSSNADDVREYAYGILAHVHEALSADAATDFKPGRQIHLMLDTLRNAIQEPLEGVSSLITVFMNDAVSILSRPGHAMYPHLNHFLLARPALDLSDVPMFYSLFNSHSPLTYKQERSWLLHGLRRGVREDADVSLLIRRHVPSILLSFFASDLADDHTQLLVANILTAMLKTETGATYLLTKCAFLEWLTARFHESSSSSLGVLQALSILLENSLQTELWEHIDSSQRHALSTAAVNCYEVFTSAVTHRHAHKIPATKELMARVAQLLLQRAYAACSLATFTTLFDVTILSNDEGDSSIAMACAEELATSRLLTHPEFQKHRFAEWSTLLARVARVVSQELRVLISAEATADAVAATSVGQEIRAKEMLTSLRSVLVEAPTLRLLVLEQLQSELTTAALLL